MRTLQHLLLSLLVLSVWANSAFAQSSDEEQILEEVVVIGRQPGPPMWQVSNGDNVLWIFPHISTIPKGMNWESDKVAKVIAESQESISMPGAAVKISKLVMLNPINIVRGLGFAKRISRNEDKATLQEVIPEDLYQRFTKIKEIYFPKDKKIEKLRPMAAGGRMIRGIYDEENLVGGESISKAIRKLVRRNKDMKKTEIEIKVKIEGGYKAITSRVENLIASLSKEQELSCFEKQISRMEDDLEDIKYRANAWARGYIDEFRKIPLRGDEDDDCTNMLLESSEKELMDQITNDMETQWLTAVDIALANNASTFTVLNISELLRKNGLLSKLRDKGYEIKEP